jgi:hypothetical protein
MSRTVDAPRTARPYRVGTRLTQDERDQMVAALLQTGMDEATLILASITNMFYTLERANEGYTEVSFVNGQGDAYSAPLIEIPS